jgi:peroxiredoxin
MTGTAQTVDDGAYDHLHEGMLVPDVILPATTGGLVNVVAPSVFTVLFLYPMTGVPDRPLPKGWLDLPGAFGCTAESCSYRDLNDEFERVDATVHGVSTQTMAEQKEFAERERIDYPLLSDAEHTFRDALDLPVFRLPGHPARIKRATLIVDRQRRLRKVMYPIPDPAANAADALAAVARLNPS